MIPKGHPKHETQNPHQPKKATPDQGLPDWTVVMKFVSQAAMEIQIKAMALPNQRSDSTKKVHPEADKAYDLLIRYG